MLRSTLVIKVLLLLLVSNQFANAFEPKNSCEPKLTQVVTNESVDELLQEAQKQIATDEAQAKQKCNGNVVCVEQKSANSVQRALQWLGRKGTGYFSDKADVIKGTNIRTLSGPKRDFWLTLWLVYAYQTFGMAAYEFSKGRFDVSDIHLDIFPATFVKLWMQKETQARKTSGLKDEVLNDKEIIEMKSSMKGFINGVIKAYAGNQNFFQEVGSRLRGFLDLLPWGAATMVGFRLAEAAIRPDYQFDMNGVKTDVLLTLIFDGYLALRWSMFDAPMIRVFDSLKKCSSETCVQKYGRLLGEVGLKSALMSGDSLLFFYLRNDWLPALVQVGTWGSLMTLIFGGG